MWQSVKDLVLQVGSGALCTIAAVSLFTTNLPSLLLNPGLCQHLYFPVLQTGIALLAVQLEGVTHHSYSLLPASINAGALMVSLSLAFSYFLQNPSLYCLPAQAEQESSFLLVS